MFQEISVHRKLRNAYNYSGFKKRRKAKTRENMTMLNSCFSFKVSVKAI